MLGKVTIIGRPNVGKSSFFNMYTGHKIAIVADEAGTTRDIAEFEYKDEVQKWLDMIIQGKTFAEIAETYGTSKRRVQDVIDLAILAPDILVAIANGEQPECLTSDYLVKSGVPAVWTDQRDVFARQ